MGRKIISEDGELYTQLLALELRGMLSAHSYTITQAAKILGHSRATLSNWLSNKVPIPVAVAFRLCSLTGVPLAEVAERAWQRYQATKLDEFAQLNIQRHPLNHATDDEMREFFGRLIGENRSSLLPLEQPSSSDTLVKHPASETLERWLNSPGHRENIENPNYKYFGVGFGIQITKYNSLAFYAFQQFSSRQP